MVNTCAIILMAGFSTRFGEETNKQLANLNGKPIFEYSIDTFSKNNKINNVVIVVNNQIQKDVEQYVRNNQLNAKIVLGGNSRQESVENALKTLKLDKDDIVVIHDAARPLISEQNINDVISGAISFGACTTYMPAVDTIALRNESDQIIKFEERKSVALIQTPQAFKYEILVDAHKNANNYESTDDCSLVQKNNNSIKLVAGGKLLHKITTKEDIKILEGLLDNERV